MKKLPLVIIAFLSTIITLAQTPAKKTTTPNKSAQTVPAKPGTKSSGAKTQVTSKPTQKPPVKTTGKAPVKKVAPKSTTKAPVKSPAKPEVKAVVETPPPAPETPADISGKDKVKLQGQAAAKAIKNLGSNLFKGKSKKGEKAETAGENQDQGGAPKETTVKEVAPAKKTDPVAKVTNPGSGGAGRVSKVTRGSASRPTRVQGSNRPGGASRSAGKVKVTKVVKGRK